MTKRQKISQRKCNIFNDLYIGADSQNRTGTELPPTDFKSVASTSSAISARELKAVLIIAQIFFNVKPFLVFFENL